MVVPLENAIASVWSVIAKHIQEEPDFKVHAQGPLALSSLFLSAAWSRRLLAAHVTLVDGCTPLPISLLGADCLQAVHVWHDRLTEPGTPLHCPALCHDVVMWPSFDALLSV